MCDRMESKNDSTDQKMKMWKMRKEMLDALGEKELRAFITGYMMAESKMMRKMGSKCSCGCTCCSGCSCGSSCNCKGDSCTCSKE